MKVLAGIEKGHPIADTYSDQRRADGREDRKVVPVGYVVAGMYQQAAMIWAPVNAVGHPTVQAAAATSTTIRQVGGALRSERRRTRLGQPITAMRNESRRYGKSDVM